MTNSAVVYGGSSDGIVNFWERENNFSCCGVMNGHKMAVLCLATTRSLVFSGSADHSICVWTRDAGGAHTCLSILRDHGGPVKCIAVVDDPNPSSGNFDQRWIMYSGSLDKSVKVWRVSKNKHASRMEHDDYVQNESNSEEDVDHEFGRKMQAH